MHSEKTDYLLKVLRSADLSDIDDYCKSHPDVCDNDFRPFAQYIDLMIAERGLSRQQLILKADFPLKFGYKLLSEEKKTRERDYILRFCLALGLSLEETQRALVLYGFSPLYAKTRRDAVIITAINKGVIDIEAVNDWLTKYDLPLLKRSGEE